MLLTTSRSQDPFVWKQEVEKLALGKINHRSEVHIFSQLDGLIASHR